MKTNKKGISLIVLVITIIVMIILATAIILSLNGSNIVEKAKEARNKMDLQSINEFASTIYSDENLRTNGNINKNQLYMKVRKALENKNIDLNKYEIISATNGVQINEIATVDELQKQFEFKYYSSLSKAISDVNNDTIGENTDATKEEAIAGIYMDLEYPIIVLLKDTTETEKLIISKDMTINLGGKTVIFNSRVGIDTVADNKNTITINGRIAGSKMIIKGTNEGGQIIQTRSNTVVLNGGEYILSLEKELEITNSLGVNVGVGGNLFAKDCSFNIFTLDTAKYEKLNLYSVYIREGGKAELTNCSIDSYSDIANTNIYTIANKGEVALTNCYILSDATTTSALAENKSLSMGIYQSGVANITDTYVFGTHSGVQTNSGSKTYVNGGVFESPGHGGFYFAHGASGEAYIEGAKIVRSRYNGRYEDFEISANGALYVGSTSDNGNNMVVNVNNCDITNYNGPAIVLSNSYGGKNNTIRISNSTINTGSTIRIDSDTQKLYIGQGNNFNGSIAFIPTNKTQFDLTTVIFTTNEVYSR